jgi:FkbM family methyltransferase
MSLTRKLRFKLKEFKFFDRLIEVISDEGIVKSIINDESRLADLSELEKEFLGELIKNKTPNSIYKSQIGQDIFTNIILRGKKNGFFIEIGVGDGTYLSNSYYFEKNKDWKGVLCEPNKDFHEVISGKRNAVLCKDAIYNKSIQNVNLLSVDEFKEYSTLEMSGENDHINREKATLQMINTITFDQLAEMNDLPLDIDYISIDTEGSEFEILSCIDLKKFNVSVFTIEHNYDVIRQNKLKDYLFAHGYKLFNPILSHFDYWFYKI